MPIKKSVYTEYLKDSMESRQVGLIDRREELTAKLLAAKDEATRIAAAKAVNAPVVSGGGKSPLTNAHLTHDHSTPTSKASGKLGKTRVPTKGNITNPYGKPNSRYSAGYHTGVDYGAAYGTRVNAAAGGVVSKVSSKGAYGNHIFIKHPDGHTTVYAHLNSINVKQGQKVKSGAKIGGVGSSGTSTGPHLHFELRKGAGGYNDNINPYNWLKKR